MVLAWPSGKILRVANGTTAGDVFLTTSNTTTASQTFLVNVNNRLVPSNTKLSDGDFVVAAANVGGSVDRYERVRL